MRLRNKLLSLILVFAFVSPLLADDWDDAVAAYHRGDYATAFPIVKRYAEQGDPDAQFILAGMYFAGEGVPQDYKKAAKWVTKAAEQGDPEAQTSLGKMYRFGKGVPQDCRKEVKWDRKAAEQGFPKAQTMLGASYFLGEGVPQDYVQAYMWGSLGASSGNQDSVQLRDLIAEKMTPSQIEKAQELSRKKWAEINK